MTEENIKLFDSELKVMDVCSIKASFYVEIMQAIKVIDSEAFVSVVNSYETGYLDKERRKRLRKY